MNKLKFNKQTAIFNIINTIILISSWFIIELLSMNTNANDWPLYLMYIIQIIGIILNAISIYKSKKNSISITGAVLGTIGSVLPIASVFILALPSIVLLIISEILLFKQKPSYIKR